VLITVGQFVGHLNDDAVRLRSLAQRHDPLGAVVEFWVKGRASIGRE
jgi:hypothetical protein